MQKEYFDLMLSIARFTMFELVVVYICANTKGS